MALQVIWEPNGVCWIGTGAVTADELLDASMAMYGDPRFDTLRYKMVDLSMVEQFLAVRKDMLKLLHLDRAAALSNRNIRVAIVADPRALPGFADSVLALKKRKHAWPTRYFEVVSDARAWAAEVS